MRNVYMFRNVREVLVKKVHTPPQPPPPPPWWSYDSMRNVYMFRNIREVLVKNVNTPPSPPPPWWSYDSMCNMLKTPKNQILYPHFGKPHFWNLQPFQGIVNGTSQNWQPFQGRRISRMPKTSKKLFWNLDPGIVCVGLGSPSQLEAKTAQLLCHKKPVYPSRSAGKRLLRTGWDWMGLGGLESP